jgi:hypothetical protein
MIRFRAICTVKYGQFREFYQAMQDLNQVCQSRGWVTATFWGPLIGANNEFVAEYDYPDLATFQAEGDAAQNDADFMKIFRSTEKLIYPQSARTELYQSATQIA